MSNRPEPARVHVPARDMIADVLRAWTGSDDRYVEVMSCWGMALKQGQLSA